MGHRYGLHNKLFFFCFLEAEQACFGAGGWTEKSIFKLGQTGR
jgi:hypothetical protein